MICIWCIMEKEYGAFIAFLCFGVLIPAVFCYLGDFGGNKMKVIFEGNEKMFGDKVIVMMGEDIWLKTGETDAEPVINLSKETALAMAKAIIKEIKRVENQNLAKCAECGIIFTQTRSDQIYHSQKCGTRHKVREFRKRKKETALAMAKAILKELEK